MSSLNFFRPDYSGVDKLEICSNLDSDGYEDNCCWGVGVDGKIVYGGRGGAIGAEISLRFE